MATENDKILALQAGAQRRACVVPVAFTLFIASHFNSALSRMKILSGETRPDTKKIPKKKIMNILIAIDEIESRRKVKAAGGKWDPKRQVWQLPYEKVTELGLSDRIVDNEPF